MSDAGDETRAAVYELAFEEAGRALDAQERGVGELRNRAGVLVAAAAITTSFFGSRAVSGPDLGGWAWTAIVAFVLLGVTVLDVLWPRGDWSFNADASDVIAEYAEQDPLPPATVHCDLALHRAVSYSRNADRLRWLFRAFRLGLLLLIAEVSAWLVAVIQRD